MRKVSVCSQIFINCDTKNPTTGLQATGNQTSLLPLPTKPLSQFCSVVSATCTSNKISPEKGPFCCIKPLVFGLVSQKKLLLYSLFDPITFSHIMVQELFCSWTQTLEAEKVCRISHLIQGGWKPYTYWYSRSCIALSTDCKPSSSALGMNLCRGAKTNLKAFYFSFFFFPFFLSLVSL